MEWIYDLVGPDDRQEDWFRRRERIRERIAATLGPMPVTVPEPDLQVSSEEDKGTYTQRKISFAAEEDDRVTAWLLVPNGATGPRPAVLCLHETAAEGKERVMGTLPGKDGLAFAPELARRGYVTLAPDIVSTGERVFEGAAPLDTAPFYRRYPERTVEGKILWDHQRCLDLLQGLPEVDGDRIGTIGHSLGGRSAHYLGAFDDRPGCTVMSCGICPHECYYRLFRTRSLYDPLPTRRQAVTEHNRLPFEKHELMGLIAPKPLLIVTPANDPERRHDVISEMVHRVFEVYKLLGAPQRFARTLHGFGHNTPPFVRDTMYRWLDLHLADQRISDR